MPFTVAELAELVSGAAEGDGTRVITGANSIESAGPFDLAFAASRKTLRLSCHVARGLPDGAAFFRAIHKSDCDTSGGPAGRVCQSAGEPLSAQALAGGRSPIGGYCASAEMGAQLPCWALSSRSEKMHRIADGCQIGAGCVLGDDVTIGNGSTLHARVTIYDRVMIGARVIIHSGW